jgi:Cu/Ag efflux protein CusF
VVYTRGEFRGVSRQGGHTYAHIKVAAGMKLPFSTLTYRIADVPVPEGVQPGSAVEFRAKRVDGENVLVEIRAARG